MALAGVEVISCSTLPSAGSCDLTLVVVDRHDSQPLDDCMKQSVREGLHSVLQSRSSGHDAGPGHSPTLVAAALRSLDQRSAQTCQRQQLQQQLVEPCLLQRHSSTDSRYLVDLCRAHSATETAQHSDPCSRQPSFSEALQDKQLLQPLEHPEFEQGTNYQHTSCSSCSRGDLLMQNSSSKGSTRFNLSLSPLAEDIASPNTAFSSLRPALKIDIPSALETGLNSSSSLYQSSSSSHASNPPSSRTTPAEFAGFEPIRHVMSLSISSRGAASVRKQQQQHGLQAEDLAQRLMELGMQRSPDRQLAHDSSSEDESETGPSSTRGSTIPSSRECRWQGPLSRQRTVNGNSAAEALDANSSEQPWHRSSPMACRSSSNSVRRTISATGQQAAAATMGASWQPERSAISESSLGCYPASSVPASPFIGEKVRAVALLSPCDSKPPASARRRPPPRTPSRIILSPVASDGTIDPGAQPKLFVSIPKQFMDDKRSQRRQVGRSQSSKVMATTPSSSSARQMLQQLAGQDSFDKLTSTVTSPTAAEAAAAAEAASKMSFNVAAAAAQLLGKNRDAAAAAIATAVAGDNSPLMCSPEQTAPCSAANSVELLMSPVAPTPRGVPPTPATPVHPIVAAVAAVAFRAAAEAVGEAAAAESAGGVTGVIEEGEEGSSLIESMDNDSVSGDSMSDSSSEEWWCGSLTGMVVRDIMTGPLKAVHQDADVAVARQLMVQHNLPGILVDTGADVPGFLTRRDFFKPSVTRRSHKKRHLKPRVRDIMSHPVISVDVAQPIELCAQLMQEQGIRRAAVTDPAAADPRNPLTAYVGLVSDATIFRYLGLYPEEGTALEEEEQGMLGLPPAMRAKGMTDSSLDGSAFDTPNSSRAATPLLQATSTQSRQQPAHEQQQQLRSSSTGSTFAAGISPSGPCDAGCVTSPKALLTPGRDFVDCTPLSRAASLDLRRPSSSERPSSGNSSMIGRATEQELAGGSISSTAAASDNGSVDVPAPDALQRYKTAAALWEVDMDEMEFLKKIGEGSFGEVMVASYRGTKVRDMQWILIRLPQGQQLPTLQLQYDVLFGGVQIQQDRENDG